MGNGWHEWPLVIFTVLGQCVVGALIVSGIGWFAAKNDADRQRIVRGMFFLWLLMGIGFIASVMHLGSPLRAFNSLNRIGASGLSNEIAAGSIFFAVGGLWWLVAVIGKMPQALGKLWLLVSMALGVIFVWMMTCVYQIDTVPTWHNGYTTLAFFLTVLLSGPILAAAILRAARVTFNTTPFAIISVLAGGITALVACALASLFSTRERTELSLRNTSHGSKSVSITAVNGISRIASDLVPQLVSSSPIMVALARVPGYVPSFPPVWDITLEHPPSNVIPLHIMNANNTFLIIINSSVDRGCWPDEL